MFYFVSLFIEFVYKHSGVQTNTFTQTDTYERRCVRTLTHSHIGYTYCSCVWTQWIYPLFRPMWFGVSFLFVLVPNYMHTCIHNLDPFSLESAPIIYVHIHKEGESETYIVWASLLFGLLPFVTSASCRTGFDTIHAHTHTLICGRTRVLMHTKHRISFRYIINWIPNHTLAKYYFRAISTSCVYIVAIP